MVLETHVVAGVLGVSLVNVVVAWQTVHVNFVFGADLGDVCFQLGADEFTGAEGPDSELAWVVKAGEESVFFAPD